jgi:tRNA U38,U39,U40 pseudouridine synthase TruA
VSAISQIISFHSTSVGLSAENILTQFREHRSVKEGKLAVFECKEVPRKFNALFSATWRRYLYFFPLNKSNATETQKQNQELESSIINEFEDDADLVQKRNTHLTDTVPLPPLRYFPHSYSGMGIQSNMISRAISTNLYV